MNKLIDIEISNNTILISFENGYIRFNNLKYFNFEIKNCDSSINYLNFFSGDYDNPKFICANNGKAILIDINDIELDYQEDDEELNCRLDLVLKDNFIVKNIEEFEDKEMRRQLHYVFDEIKQEDEQEEFKRACEENRVFVKNNINEILSDMKAHLDKNEFNFLITYLLGNYDLVVLKDGLKINNSKSLKKTIRNYVENEIDNILQKYGFTRSIYNIVLLQNMQEFCSVSKSKRLIYNFDVEEIGPKHNKTWQILNFSY